MSENLLKIIHPLESGGAVINKWVEKDIAFFISCLLTKKLFLNLSSFIWLEVTPIAVVPKPHILLNTYFDKYPYPKAQTINFFHHLTILV